MTNLEKYIEKVKEYKSKHPDLKEEELIRYVYIDLGKRFSFDTDFAFGKKSTKNKIYANSRNEEELDEAMESNVAICRSLCYILEHVLTELGVNIKTVALEQYDFRKCSHVYNVIIPKEGEKYILDLQLDLRNIQSHSYTKYFGVSNEDRKTQLFSRLDQERMDKKLGFVDENEYYADEYLYFLKMNMEYFENFQEKVQFVLENIDAYENKDMKYVERKWQHEKIVSNLFSKKELNKIDFIDCYEEKEKQREYKNCIVVQSKGETDVYIYSIEECRYKKMSIQEFAEKTKNGLKTIQGVPGLKQALKQIENESRV